MKCIKDESGNIVRVTDKVAAERLKSGKWSYCNKDTWVKAGKKYDGPMPKASVAGPGKKRANRKPETEE